MKTSDILQAFHGMPACDRLDLLCRMLHYCVPYEAHFLGTVLVDTSREHYNSFVGKAEVSANRVNYYSSFKDVGLTHEVCEKLCCALAVVHADNHPVAEAMFNLLNDPRVLKQLDEMKDPKMMQDFKLLYVMGANHPAFTFNQRQRLLYTYLQHMDTVFAEKAKFGFSLSNSMEKTLTSDGDVGCRPPEGLKEPAPDAYITHCEVHSVYKRVSDKRYVYMILVEWSDGTQYTIRRTYGDFFSFQTKLLDLFPEEGGQKGKKHPRLIPFLPGKNYSRFLKNKEVAEKRLPELHRYSKELMSLPDRITRFPHVLEFFKPRSADEKEEYPPLHKITNLYDLVEAGKTRLRVQSEPGVRGSPTHSPMLHRSFDSPLHRAVPTTIGQPNGHVDSPSPRSAKTLPPAPVTTSQANSENGSPSVIPRRPTYPLPHKLKKSENSAFTPIGVSALSEDELASTATLTASQISIPPMIPDSSSTPLSSASNTLVSGSSLSGYAATQHVTLHNGDTQPATAGDATSSGSSTSGETGTLQHVSSVTDHSGEHVQPVATTPSSLSTGGNVTTSGNSSGSNGDSGHGNYPEAQGDVQKMSNHVSSNLPADTHPNVLHSHSASGAASTQAVPAQQNGSELGSSGQQSESEAHTLTRTHPDATEEQGEVASPSLNMEGGSTAWIDTVNQSFLAYTSPGSIIHAGSPHHQYLPHTAVMHPVLPAQGNRAYNFHNQTSPTSVVNSSIVSSNISPSPTHSETSTHSGGMPYSPGLMQYQSPYSPIPQMYPHISPLTSPIPLIKKTNRRQFGSNVSVNRMPTENDTLLMWMKSLRLHKYYSKFENTTFEEMCSLSVEMMKEKGLTEGAAKKLHKKLEELRGNNFPGFSGMPIAPGMTRKPSTCSLPASLLMEQQRMTPSSSCEGLSPTGSTCSLGMVGHGHLRRTPTPSHGHRHSSSHSAEHHRHLSRSESASVREDPSSVAVMDAAIVRVVPSVHSPPFTSPDSTSSRANSSFSSEVGTGNLLSESPLRGVTDHNSAAASATSQQVGHSSSVDKSSSGHAHKANGPITASSSVSKSVDKEELTSSWKSVGGASNGSSWADEVVSSEEAGQVNRPEWANMSSLSSPSVSSSSGRTVSPAAVTKPTTTGGVTVSQSSSVSHHHHHQHHYHHHHHPPSSQGRTVHQIHSSNNSVSDIIPIQTNPSHSSPFHSPSSSSSSSFTSSSTSSISSSATPSHTTTSTSQHHTGAHLSTPTSSTTNTTTTSAHSTNRQKQAHVPIAKRNSSEVSSHSAPVLQAVPPHAHHMFIGGNRTPNIVGVTAPSGGGSSGGGGTRGSGHSWIVRPVLLPKHPVTVIGVPAPSRTQHHQVIHTSSPAAVHNGLMRPVPPQTRLPTTATIVPAPFVRGQPGGLVICPSVNVNHASAPAMCFNCGKRGHLGNSCPGVTMEANNPDNFHKKLEKRVSSKRSS